MPNNILKMILSMILGFVCPLSLADIVCKETPTQIVSPKSGGISLYAFGSYLVLPENYYVSFNPVTVLNTLFFNGLQYSEEGTIIDSEDIGAAQLGPMEKIPDHMAKDFKNAHTKIICNSLLVYLGTHEKYFYMIIHNDSSYFYMIDYRDRFWLSVLHNFIN